ncbi:hypothetical protein [Desulfitobacterium sp.]|uniref:hypothetical protein n=1 Tax=Desulfitobacterium sp. TaxID=49981 RepID=UPI002B1FDA08|nr:hypothetical protein [Desulfitobacterium sp.]MEA4900055.1 hypothetical protein [Desulfitobacterium sp.]
MWPKRKILILAPHGTEEGPGLQSLLGAFQIETILRQVSVEDPLDLKDLTIPGVDDEDEGLPDYGPTEIVYWPEFEVNNSYRQWGEKQGLLQEPVFNLLHKLWEQEVILPVSEDEQEEGRPLLWKFLAGAGYEPSLLWFDKEGRWVAERRRGLHWVVSANWLKGLIKDSSVGRPFRNWLSEGAWVINDDSVDFYANRSKFRFIGNLPRYPKSEAEESIYRSILLALQLGVSWREVKQNIRWNVNGVERNQGTNRTEYFVEDAEHVEDRWYS